MEEGQIVLDLLKKDFKVTAEHLTRRINASGYSFTLTKINLILRNLKEQGRVGVITYENQPDMWYKIEDYETSSVTPATAAAATPLQQKHEQTRDLIVSDVAALPLHQKQRGSITVVLGAMFSGKSKRLLNIAVDRYLMAGKDAILIKYGKDTRYTRGNLIKSHDGQQFTATPLDSLGNFKCPPIKPCAIGIDEGQFFKGLASFCLHWAKQGINIYIAGLLADSENKMWPEMIELLPHVTHIEFLSAICVSCGSPNANYSVKFVAAAASNENREDIGGSEKYASVCLGCRDIPIQPEKLEKRKEIIENINRLKQSF
jgi:thymidine kinase